MDRVGGRSDRGASSRQEFHDRLEPEPLGERKRLGDRVRLLRSFDPTADPADLDLSDPYYGGTEDFTVTREQIEKSMPGLVVWAVDRLA